MQNNQTPMTYDSGILFVLLELPSISIFCNQLRNQGYFRLKY